MPDTIFQRIKTSLIYWLARRLPDCKTVTPKLGESLDRKLGFRATISLKLHLITCKACERYLSQIEFLKQAAQRHGEGELLDRKLSTAILAPEAKQRLKDALRQHLAS
jgi:hypothetical protein